MLETAYVSTGDVFKYQCIDINSGKCLKRYIDLGTGNPLSKPAWKLVYKNVLYKRQFSVLFRSIKRNSPTRQYAPYVIKTNDALLKVLYYGFGGPGDVFRDDQVTNDTTKYLYTHIMAS